MRAIIADWKNPVEKKKHLDSISSKVITLENCRVIRNRTETKKIGTTEERRRKTLKSEISNISTPSEKAF